MTLMRSTAVASSLVDDVVRETQQTSFPGDNRDVEPPESISNSEVKSVIADDSVGFPHVKVGHHQVITPKARAAMFGLFLCLKLTYKVKIYTHLGYF